MTRLILFILHPSAFILCRSARIIFGMPTAPPCSLVLFGDSGDLAKRKLIPSLYDLARDKLLPDGFALVGYARTEMSDDDYRKECRDAIANFSRAKSVDESVW